MEQTPQDKQLVGVPANAQQYQPGAPMRQFIPNDPFANSIPVNNHSPFRDKE